MKRGADYTFNVGAGGPRSLDGWHAALELGARGVWMGGTRLWSWGPAVLDGTKTKIQLPATSLVPLICATCSFCSG